MDNKKLYEAARRADETGADWRSDAALSALVDQQLTYVSTIMYEYEFPKLKSSLVLPMNTSIPDGAARYEFRTSKSVGQAEVTESYADDSPSADAFLSEDNQAIVPYRIHYNYSVQDMREALLSGTNVQTLRALSAREAVEKAVDSNMATGNTDRGILGFLNQTAVPASNAANPGPGTTWAVKTPDQRNADIFTAITTMQTATNGIEGQGVDVVLPDAQYFLLSAERIPEINMSGLEYLRASVPQVRSITPWHLCAGAGAGSTDRMVIYDRSDSKLQGLLPLALYTHIPEQRGMTWQVELEARAGGVVFYKPLSARYVDAI